MTYQLKLQIPISEELNNKLKKKAKEIGFSSVNEIARLLLTNFVNNNLVISFVSKLDIEGSNKESLKQIIADGLIEYKEGKTKKLNFSKSLHNQLIED